MILRKLFDYLIFIRKYNQFKRNATLTGDDYKFGRASYVSISDGSSKADVVISDHVWIYGALQSQNHGKIHLGKYTKVGVDCKLQSVESIIIDDYTTMADNVVIADNNNHPVSPSFRLYMRTTSDTDDSRRWKYSAHAPIYIGKNCWIGQNARINKGVMIGDNCIVAANSVVTKSAPANCIIAGNPARIVKTDIDKVEAPATCEGYNDYVR